MRAVLAALAGWALCGAGAWAQAPSAPAATQTPAAAEMAPSPAPPATPPKKEKKICRRAPETGSFISNRTCHTQAEWDEIDASRKGVAESFLDEVNKRPDEMTRPH